MSLLISRSEKKGINATAIINRTEENLLTSTADARDTLHYLGRLFPNSHILKNVKADEHNGKKSGI